MTRRNKILLLTILVIILIALIVLVVWIIRRDALPRSTRRAATTTERTAPPIPTATVPTVIEPAPTGPIEQNPRVVALDFTERYGSYSSQGNYQNIRDLFPQMTAAMRVRAKATIAATPLDDSTYNGFTTQAIRAEVTDSSDSRMTFTVETQRTETSVQYPEGRTFYQTAVLALVKSDLKWLVDSFEWK